jgi:hypothetical protein
MTHAIFCDAPTCSHTQAGKPQQPDLSHIAQSSSRLSKVWKRCSNQQQKQNVPHGRA